MFIGSINPKLNLYFADLNSISCLLVIISALSNLNFFLFILKLYPVYGIQTDLPVNNSI